MPSHTMTLALPEDLYRTVSTLAQVTKRPLAEILQDSLAHTLPPLDDVPAKEVAVLAHMSTLDDAALWHASRVTMPESQQEAFHALLDRQSARGTHAHQYCAPPGTPGRVWPSARLPVAGVAVAGASWL